MPRLFPVLAATLTLAAGGLAVAGCGSDDSSSSTSTAAPAPAAITPATSTPTGGASANAGADTAAGKTVAISMKNIAFDPKDTTVNVGEKVVWTNDDTVQHNVVADSGATFKSDIFGKGGTYEYTPKAPGTITYECTLHPGMTGTLKVSG